MQIYIAIIYLAQATVACIIGARSLLTDKMHGRCGSIILDYIRVSVNCISTARIL